MDNLPIASVAPTLLNYGKIKRMLVTISTSTNISCKPTYKIVRERKIIAIITDSARFIPVKPTVSVKDGIPVSELRYYPEADKYLYSAVKLDDARSISIARENFEHESYQRLRFEISKYLHTKPKLVKEIEKIVENDKTDVVKKRSQLKEILNKLFKELVTTTGSTVSIDYVKPNFRRSCFQIRDGCSGDPHCVLRKDGRCMLYISPKNLITGKDNLQNYKSIIADELVRNRKLRTDILYDGINYIVDRTVVDSSKGSTIIYGDHLLEDVQELYRPVKEIYESEFTPFERLNPPTDVSRLYAEDNIFLNIEQLSPY